MTDLNRSGIYEIRNLVSGKRYIGSAVNIKRRWYFHREHLRLNKHHNLKLQSAWNKYGEKLFIFEVVFFCLKEQLISYEQQCIDGYDTVFNGYNIRTEATSNFGLKMSEETRQRMKVAQQKRRLENPVSEETKRRMSVSNKGQRPSELARKMSSILKKGKPSWNSGKKMSVEFVEKCVQMNKNRTITTEHRQKMIAGIRRFYENKREA